MTGMPSFAGSVDYAPYVRRSLAEGGEQPVAVLVVEVVEDVDHEDSIAWLVTSGLVYLVAAWFTPLLKRPPVAIFVKSLSAALSSSSVSRSSFSASRWSSSLARVRAVP